MAFEGLRLAYSGVTDHLSLIFYGGGLLWAIYSHSPMTGLE